MHIPLQYAYFTGTIICLIIWLILYLHRKEMIAMSILVGILGLFFDWIFCRAFLSLLEERKIKKNCFLKVLYLFLQIGF